MSHAAPSGEPIGKTSAPAAPTQPRASASGRILGIVLLLPAALLTLVQFAIPSLMTFASSFQRVTLRPAGDFIGLENYAGIARLLPGVIGVAVGLSLIAAVIGVSGGLIGTLAARGGALPRRITAAVAGILLTLYAPVGMTLAMALGNGPLLTGSRVFAVLVISLLVGLPPVLGGGVVAGLLTGRPGTTRTTALLTAGLVGIVAACSVGLQAFAIPMTLGPAGRLGGSLQSVAFELGFRRADFGRALAMETLVLAGLGLLGTIAVIVLAVGRLRLELTGPTSDRGSAVGWIGLGAAVVALLVVLVIHRGWLAGLVAPVLPEPAGGLTTRWMLNTWGPSLLLTVIQVAVSGAAGFGLGWLRPAGRGSRWLLLLFAPWLLVGITPLAVPHFLIAMQLDLLDTPLTVLPPMWVSLPALVAFGWLFSALGDAHRASRAGTGTSSTGRGVLTGAAGTVLVGGLLWVTGAQSLTWGYVTGRDLESLTGPVALLQLATGRPSGSGPAQWISTPIPVLVGLAIVIAGATVLTTDRLALVTGAEPAPGPRPPTPAPPLAVGDLGHGPTSEQAHPAAPAVVPGRDRHGPVQG